MNWVIDFAELATMARVALGVVIAMGILPMVVLPRPAGARNWLDSYVARLVRWVAIVIVLTHILAGIGIYTAVAVIAVIGSIAWFARYRGQLGGFIGILNLIFPPESGSRAPERDKKPKTPRAVRVKLFLMATPILGVLIASYYLRVKNALGLRSLSPPDAYVHMAWADSFRDNQLWPDGVYPQGLAAIVSFIDFVTPFTELVDVVKFVGPLVGTFLVFAIFYAVLRLSRNAGAALFAAGLLGLFGANPEWREPWERLSGLLPQEFGLAIAFIAVVFAVLAVTEKGGGQLLRLASDGGIALGGNVTNLACAAFVAAMCHPLAGGWLGLLVAAAAVPAALVSRRFSHLVGAGVASLVGAGVGFAVVPMAQLFGVPAYLGYGAGDAFADLGGSDGDDNRADLEVWFGELEWLAHNWLSLAAAVFVAVGLGAAVFFILRPATRQYGAQLLGLTATGGVAVALYDLSGFAYSMEPFYAVRLANLLGPTLALAFGAGLGGLGWIVIRRASYPSIAMLLVAGILALGAFGTQFPADAIERFYIRENIEWEEMTRETLELKSEFDRGTYTVVGMSSQKQVLGDHGFFIEQWVFARDVQDIPHAEILPVPTPETLVFAEVEPYPIIEVSDPGPTSEYYFNLEKRARLQAAIVQWAEERRREDPNTTLYYEGEHIRVYRISRNPAVLIDRDSTAFTDYTYRPDELFNDGPASPKDVLDSFPEFVAESDG
ncbi:MAG: hypothetical protein WD532_00235 [Acidimicrobiia bacterium]